MQYPIATTAAHVKFHGTKRNDPQKRYQNEWGVINQVMPIGARFLDCRPRIFMGVLRGVHDSKRESSI